MKWAIITLNKVSIEVARTIKEAFYKLETEDISEIDEIKNDEIISKVSAMTKVSNNKNNVVDIYTLHKYLEDGIKPIEGKLKTFNKYLFETYDCLVYVMSMGIVVRDISPYIKHKSTDPAVLCVSIDSRFVIPVLSGHLGGANEFAKTIGKLIQAVPVITTASDLLGKEAVDLIAKKNGLIIDSFKTAMDLTARMINNETITLISETQLSINNCLSVKWNDLVEYLSGDDSNGYVYIGYHKQIPTLKPIAKLIPKCLVVGIGARKETKESAINELLREILRDNNLDIRAINGFKSIDIKKNEKGIIDIAKHLDVPYTTYTAQELSQVSSRFEESKFVKSITGVGSVCMPSGYLGSNKGTCVVEKVAKNGITISIWEEI